ncbi:hypothetical protein [Pedobacter nutrimenti]|uniref:SusE-like outer membrane protein n=1 Tax=Pedobacter nutrimenti TaxID=1241337 RepID=A0A318U601_9SPHI|nr:hypothetical protein [Pedobacter nutrimenti]PYF68465.1 hypothetical protein B0O44_11252 [Pedobacter nutrimenti]
MKIVHVRTLLFLFIAIFAVSCKKDSEVAPDPAPSNFKYAFEEMFSKANYYVNVNPLANTPLETDAGKYTSSLGIYSRIGNSPTENSYVWLLKPIANQDWKTEVAKEILMDYDFHQVGEQLTTIITRKPYMLDQILLPSDFNGASIIFPLQSTANAINNPLKATVEYWKVKTVLPLVVQPKEESMKIKDYNKQTTPGTKLETRTITVNAEKFALTKAPASVTKGNSILDLNTWLDSSVKLTEDGKNVTSFSIDGAPSYVLPEGHNLDLSKLTVGQSVTIRVQKFYANGLFELVHTFNVN